MDWKEFLISIDGRASRSDFWNFLIISLVYGIIALAVIWLTGGFPAYMAHSRLFGFVIGLPLLWPTIAVSIRRLHDRNRNEDWILLFIGLPAIHSLIDAVLDIGGWNIAALGWPLFALQLVSSVATIWWFIELGFFRGTLGENKYGPDPVPITTGGGFVYRPPGYSLKVMYRDDTGKVQKQEFFYVAANDSEDARRVIQNAQGVPEDAVVILDPLSQETIQKLNLSPGSFVPAPRAK